MDYEVKTMKKREKNRRFICCFLCICLMVVLFSGCAGKNPGTSAEVTETTTEAAAKSGGIDYMVLVNKLNPLPDDWEDKVETVHMTNTVGDDVEVEKKA